MSDFDDLVSAERRRLDQQAAARAASESTRRYGELPEWQQVVARIRELLAASARHLRDAGVPSVPVLEMGKVNQRLELWGMVLAGRVSIIDRRWPLGPFALNAEGVAYPMGRKEPLIPPYPLSESPPLNKKLRKARLRTGLAPDQEVMWTGGGSPLRDPLPIDPATGVETGRVGCFGRGADGTPLLLAGNPGVGEPLESFLAKEVARRTAGNGAR
ncbi:hypothetical protein [Actinomadura opuntiae]|uniref:hypothetical protein n=1 Tax=Actinomadura sp. OS1-43 TaxID=604315 RepID=UPI00255ABB04|nr:hypothetical protein [Actinomadura sp. OS1-43]MDL4815063.1 hypothetical protein [Actinomadura sp. OS1-43]